jgi:anti-repressor protein
MTDLIKVDYSGEKPAVSARELHEFLEVKTAYKDWFPRMCEYGFSEGTDFCSFLSESTGGRRGQDAAVTIDMAKEICMLQRNEKGKMARQYFLQLERDWNSPEKVMARALQIADRRIKTLESKVQADAPKVLFADSVAASTSTILISELAKILRQNGVNTGEKRLFRWMRENGYLVKRNGTDYNMPTQLSMELGILKVKETVVCHSDGHTSISKTPKVTGKGQTYFLNKFLGEGRKA